MGGADIKLSAACAFMLGTVQGFAGLMLGLIAAIIVNIIKNRKKNTEGFPLIPYRAYRDGVTDEQIEDLKEKLYCGEATEKDIEKVTRRLGDEIGAVYGWEFPGEKPKVKVYER